MADSKEVEAQAALFALGALPDAEAAKFQKRVDAGCPYCLGLLQDCEMAVTAIALSVPEVSPRPDLKARLLQQIGAPPENMPPPKVAEIVRSDAPWEASPMAGIEYKALRQRKTMLVRMAPNTWYPEHRHAAAEQCLVLEGSITSEGETVHAGDYVYMPKGSLHAPIYTETGCVFLIAYS